MEIHTRIAPTPSGLLHAGNAYNFLFANLLVQKNGGSLRLRIDDLDAPRVREDYLRDIFDTLHWLDISWTKGPQTISEQQAIYSQQLRIARYKQMLGRLVATGQVFACTCSRKESANHSLDGQYPGTCRFRNIPLDTPEAAWRLCTPVGSVIEFNDALLGKTSINLYDTNRDFIIHRRDGFPAYHIASLADDLDHGINTIVRGADLLYSTAAQLYIASLLGTDLTKRIQFYHHPILAGSNGEKLSKSAGSTSLKARRETGILPATIYTDFQSWLSGIGYSA